MRWWGAAPNSPLCHFPPQPSPIPSHKRPPPPFTFPTQGKHTVQGLAVLSTLVLLCCLYHVYCGHGGGATKRAYQPLDESNASPTYNEARLLPLSTPAPGPWTWDPTLSKFVNLDDVPRLP